MAAALIGASIGFFSGIILAMIKAQFDYKNVLREKVEIIYKLISINFLIAKSKYDRATLDTRTMAHKFNFQQCIAEIDKLDEFNQHLVTLIQETKILLELYFHPPTEILDSLNHLKNNVRQNYSKHLKILDTKYSLEEKKDLFNKLNPIESEDWNFYLGIRNQIANFLIDKSNDLQPLLNRLLAPLRQKTKSPP